jgi:hypothetical protein
MCGNFGLLLLLDAVRYNADNPQRNFSPQEAFDKLGLLPLYEILEQMAACKYTVQ